MNITSVSLFFVLLLVLGFISVKATRMWIIAKIGLRNVWRRKVNTAIVVSGLMIGTAIISGSLVIGDTLENMFTAGVYHSLDETDEIIYTPDANGSYGFFNYSEYELLQSFIQQNDTLSHKIDGLSPEISYIVSAHDLDSKLSEADVTLIGFNYSLSTEFGKLKTIHGEFVTEKELSQGEVYVNEYLAQEMDISEGHRLIIYYGENQSIRLVVKNVVKAEGRGSYGRLFGHGGLNIFMPLERVQNLLNATGKINLIKISNRGDVRSGVKYSDDVEKGLRPFLNPPRLTKIGNGSSHDNSQKPLFILVKIKQIELQSAIDGSRGLRDLFMVLGSFTIIAGMLLIINIFVMLAEERKSEMGMARAVGMSRKHLMYMFIFEGTAYSVLSSAIGSVAGLGVAYGIILAFGSIFGGFNSLQFFTFKANSLLIAFSSGMLVTLFTIMLASRKVSRLNIIRAIRNIPEPAYTRHEFTRLHHSASLFTRFRVYTGDLILREFEFIIIFASGFLIIASFVDIGILYHTLWAGYGGLGLFIYGVGLLSRRYIRDRIAFTLSGITVLALWAYPYDLYEQLFGIKMHGGMEMFVLSGLFMVVSALMVIMYNGEYILRALMKGFGGVKSLAPILKTALTYPMDNRFRTGMTLAMFSLIIFTITVLSMIIGLISGNIDQIVEENSGGYDMIGFTNPNTPVWEIETMIDQNENLSLSDYSKIVPLYTAYTMMYPVENKSSWNKTEEAIRDNLTSPLLSFQENSTFYNLLGCTDKFFRNSDYQLQDWDKDAFSDYQSVWKALEKNSSLVIADSSLMDRGERRGPPGEKTFKLQVGDYIVVRDMRGNSKPMKVIGFTKQRLIKGVFVRADTVRDDFGIRTSYLTLFKFKEGISDSRQEDLAKDLEREFLPYGMRTFIIKKELASMIEMMNNFFYLLESYLGLGLVVGIAGLGVVTIRSVTERRQQIGMLRAIGFRREMILKSFLIESSYIALLGILIGVVLGVILGLRFWLDPESNFQGAFIIPWRTILAVSGISYLFTFLCTIGPSRSASRIPPAEALRYAE